MPSSSFTFRCPECRKLLAASMSRIGTPVVCPKCQSDLIVPVPGASLERQPTPATSGLKSVRESAELSGGPSSGGGLASTPASLSKTPKGDSSDETIVFPPIRIEEDPLSLRPPSTTRPHKMPSRSAPSDSTTPPSRPVVPALQPPLSTPEPIAAPDPPPRRSAEFTVPDIPAREPERTLPYRYSDVVLPRTGVILWSFVMFVALILSFAAGLLAGHFLWTDPARSALPPLSPPSTAIDMARPGT